LIQSDVDILFSDKSQLTTLRGRLIDCSLTTCPSLLISQKLYRGAPCLGLQLFE